MEKIVFISFDGSSAVIEHEGRAVKLTTLTIDLAFLLTFLEGLEGQFICISPAKNEWAFMVSGVEVLTGNVQPS